jgi:hypothetical protein
MLMLPAVFLPAVLAASGPMCWAEPRIYHASGLSDDFRERASERLQLRRVVRPMPRERTPSPNGGYAFHVVNAPQGDGSVVATLSVFTEADQLLEVRAKDVFNLLDVEQDKFVLMEAMEHGRLAWEQARASCGAKADLPACAERCVSLP